jgi:hypothetical protein
MELLKIDEEQNGLFYKNGNWAAIRDIERDDLLALIKAVADNDNIELTPCSSEHDIKNPIEKTIYQEVYKVLKDLVDNRDTYEAEINKQFDDLEREYKLA